MKGKIRNKHTKDRLRKRAEELLKQNPAEVGELSSYDIQSLIQELQLHRIELEMQNEELCSTQVELEESRNKYADLYDFAPVAYFSMDRNGVISEVNLTGASLVGVERKNMIGRPFSHYVDKEDQSGFRSCWKRFIENVAIKQSCELKMRKRDGTKFYAQLECIAIAGVSGEFQSFRVAVVDISRKKRAEEELQRVRRELELLVQERTQELIEVNEGLQAEIAERKKLSEELERSLAHLSRKNLYEVIIGTVTRSVHQSINLKEVLENAVDVLNRNVQGAEMVCIYMVEKGADNLSLKPSDPSSETHNLSSLYSAQAVLMAHRGCPDWFVERVGKIPYPKGVTWETIIRGVPKYCADVDQDETIGPAGRETGIKSYISVPISYEGETVGTLNIASPQKGAFDDEELSLLEIVVRQIEVAIRNAKQAGELREAKEELELRVKERTKELTGVNQELMREVAWHKWAEKILQNSEERYRALYEENPSMYLTVNREGKILLANRFGAEWLGYNLYELVGQSIYNIIIPDDINEVHEKLVDCFRNPGQVYSWEIRKVRKNGGIIRVRETARAVPDNDGSLVAMLVSEDITERKKAEDALQQQKHLYETILKAQSDVGECFFIVEDNRITYANEACSRICGYRLEEMKALTSFFELVISEHRDSLRNRFQLILGNLLEKENHEIVISHKNGKQVILEAAIHPFQIGNRTELIIISRDITGRKTARDQIAFQASLLDQVRNAVIATDLEGKIIFWNKFAEDLYQWKTKEVIGKNVFDLIVPLESRGLGHEILESVSKEGYWEGEFMVRRKDGVSFLAHVADTVIRSSDGKIIGYVGVSEDITKRKQAEEQIKASLREKEVLLKEIHHRVKNNLQIISSLLRLQSRYIKGKEAREKFKESYNRVRSMALIHEKLYQSEDFERINFAEYISSLLSYLFGTYGVSTNRIKLRIDAESVLMNIDKAIPCGLIVNEIISNSLKHAFPGETEGEVWVECREGGELIIGNNGVPFPENVNFRKTKSLGLQLVCALVEQLRGSIELDRGGGTVFRIKCSP